MRLNSLIVLLLMCSMNFFINLGGNPNMADACSYVNRNVVETIYLNSVTEGEVASVSGTVNISHSCDADGI